MPLRGNISFSSVSCMGMGVGMGVCTGMGMGMGFVYRNGFCVPKLA